MTNCRRFERDLAEWVAGRLPESLGATMTAHAAECETCARAAEGERRLRAAWRELPPLGETPDLWPQLAARISVPRDTRTARPAWLAWLPEPRIGLRYGLAGVGAALLVFVVMSRPVTTELGGDHPPVVQTANQEKELIQLVSDRQAMLPEADGDLAIMATPRYRAAERVVLGLSERR